MESSLSQEQEDSEGSQHVSHTTGILSAARQTLDTPQYTQTFDTMEKAKTVQEPNGRGFSAERLATLQRELQYLNTIGKRFVAAIDRFQVHRALLVTLQELYSFSACCILLKGDPYDLFIIPCYPLNSSFLESMIQRIASAATAVNFPNVTAEHLARTAYYDAPDDLALRRLPHELAGAKIQSSLNVPLIVENRIIGLLSLFDEQAGTFDKNLLQITTMIADYAAVALDNVRLHERENALWRDAELERLRLELIIGSMAEGLLITDERGAITSLNASAEQLLAQTLTTVRTGIPLAQLAATSNAGWLLRFIEIIQQALAGQTVKSQELVAGSAKERVPLTLSVSAAPLNDTNARGHGRTIGVVVVLNDITASKQIERLKDDFVSVVSHELRTPLTAIKGYTQHVARRIERRVRKMRATGEFALESEPPESYDLRNLAIIQSQAEHLERLVNDLLDHSQVQYGNLRLQYSAFDLATLLRETAHSIQASAEQHTITLRVECAETMVRADRVRIGQVIGNILDNAVKYSPHGGQIVVILRIEDALYHVSVIDQGIGVSAEQSEHIFERFYRLHNTASQNYSGIGLGLYVARAIINSHGGEISLVSKQGLGSTFNFTLPLKPAYIPPPEHDNEPTGPEPELQRQDL
jgi:signal transduction histidine kinase